MNKQAELIKAAIRVSLKKRGHTMEEFEAQLKSGVTEKTAANILFSPEHPKDFFSGIFNAGTLSAVGVGLTAGGLGYAGYRQLANSDEKMQKQQAEEAQYQTALRSLMEARKTGLQGI